MRTLRLSLLGVVIAGLVLPVAFSQAPSEAPTGFDNLTNGVTDQPTFEADRGVFEERETIDDGLASGMRGQFIQVPVLEAGGQLRGGRFGWKNQHASLVSFSADAYLNEMGISTPLQPNENTSNGNSVAAFDPVPDPDDDNTDVETFARFMRATKAPPRDTALAATPDAQAGSKLFDQVGCNICHVRNITTSPPGTVINRGAFTVPDPLGNKLIHPFGDFLPHNVGTG